MFSDRRTCQLWRGVDISHPSLCNIPIGDSYWRCPPLVVYGHYKACPALPLSRSCLRTPAAEPPYLASTSPWRHVAAEERWNLARASSGKTGRTGVLDPLGKGEVDRRRAAGCCCCGNAQRERERERDGAVAWRVGDGESGWGGGEVFPVSPYSRGCFFLEHPGESVSAWPADLRGLCAGVERAGIQSCCLLLAAWGRDTCCAVALTPPEKQKHVVKITTDISAVGGCCVLPLPAPVVVLFARVPCVCVRGCWSIDPFWGSCLSSLLGAAGDARSTLGTGPRTFVDYFCIVTKTTALSTAQ